MKECAPNERINWRNFRQAADPWIASVKSKCPSGHNKENVNKYVVIMDYSLHCQEVDVW